VTRILPTVRHEEMWFDVIKLLLLMQTRHVALFTCLAYKTRTLLSAQVYMTCDVQCQVLRIFAADAPNTSSSQRLLQQSPHNNRVNMR